MTTEYMIGSALLNARPIDACTAYVFYKHAKGRRRMILMNTLVLVAVQTLDMQQKLIARVLLRNLRAMFFNLTGRENVGTGNHQARRARFPEHRSLASPWTRWRCGNSVARLPATGSEKYVLNPRSLSLTFARTDLMGVAHDGGTHFRSSSTAATRWVTALRMTSASSSASALTRLRKQPSASAITSSEDAAERC